MIEIHCLHNLNQYANFETFEYNGKTIVLYDDHRCILTVLYEARKLGDIDKNTNIVTFDKHDDARPIVCTVLETIKDFVKKGIKNVAQKSFKNFVEFDIREYDDDWVCVGMELGLIKDIANIGATESTNIRTWKNFTYTDMKGEAHFGQVINHVAHEFCRTHGALGDCVLYEDFKVVRNILGYNIPGESTHFADWDTNFVLDFDLDCFTIECQGKTFAWPEYIFDKMYGYGENGAGYFMDKLIQKAKFITICREPSYCGGLGESNKILCLLDKYFFGGRLGTSAVM